MRGYRVYNFEAGDFAHRYMFGLFAWSNSNLTSCENSVCCSQLGDYFDLLI